MWKSPSETPPIHTKRKGALLRNPNLSTSLLLANCLSLNFPRNRFEDKDSKASSILERGSQDASKGKWGNEAADKVKVIKAVIGGRGCGWCLVLQRRFRKHHKNTGFSVIPPPPQGVGELGCPYTVCQELLGKAALCWGWCVPAAPSLPCPSLEQSLRLKDTCP